MQSSRSLVLQAVTAVLITLAVVWAATQWAAAMLGHQPALGTPWMSIGGIAVYAPWKLFAWWLAFDAQAPNVFRRAGMLALAGGIAPALIAIGGAACSPTRRSPSRLMSRTPSGRRCKAWHRRRPRSGR